MSWSDSVVAARSGEQTLNAAAVAAAIEIAIRSHRPKSVARTGSIVEFRAGGMRLVSNWNVLVPITSGHIEVNEEPAGVRVSYTIRFTEVLIFSAMASVFFALMVNLQGRDTPLSFRILGSLFPLLWLFGGNVAITLFRFPRLLKRAIGEVHAV